jgi:uncharacterized protein
MAKEYRLTTEFFAIPHSGDTFILYSPLKEILMLANQDMVDLVAQLRDGTFAGVNGENMDAVQLLIESGAVNGPPDHPPQHKIEDEWKPTEVTLFLTNACNLRCTYCYASAGEYKGSMDLPTAFKAIDLIVRNAVERKESHIRVSYHGGGEPTLEWETLTKSAQRAQALAKENNLDLHLSIATNGVLPAWKVDWLARNMNDFSISFDGPAWVQDNYRPTVSGKGSAETVEATLRHLDSHGVTYGVRLTVTEDSVDHLEEIVSHILKRYSPSAIHLEPLFSHGRARTKGLAAPHASAFIDNFRRAQKIAEGYGLDLYYSGARTEVITDTFCGVPEGSFNVTPEGLLTSCFEVCHPEDEFADEFFYGELDAKSNEFRVSKKQLKVLAGHTVRERVECANCFCKWHCAGDCIAKNMQSDEHPGQNLKAARCIINQELTRDRLIKQMREASRIMRQVEANASPEEETPLTPLYAPEIFKQAEAFVAAQAQESAFVQLTRIPR